MAGPTVGVMLLQNTHLSGSGSMANAGSYEGRALFETLPGVMGRKLIDQPDVVKQSVTDTARVMAGRGAEILTMNCGFGVLFQQAIAEAAEIPVVSSNLVLLPTLAIIHAGKVGILTYDKAALSAAHLRCAGWHMEMPPACADVQQFAEWRMLEEEGKVELDIDTMGRQLVETGRDLVRAHGLAALLLECSGMFPFTSKLRYELGCHVYGVFDALNLVARGRNTS